MGIVSIRRKCTGKIEYLKKNWLINFSYFESNCWGFKGVRELVEADRFEDALRLLDGAGYQYSDGPYYQGIRNQLINMADKYKELER